MWVIYNILFAIGYTLMFPRFLVRMVKRGGYRRHFMQRFGIYSSSVQSQLAMPGRVWVHAVSVGEMTLALSLIVELRRYRPELAFVVTTITSTGYRIAEGRLDSRDTLLYFPADFPWVVRRVLARLRPSCIVLTECELWPNLVRAASDQRIPVVIINGRISDRSYRGYRYLRTLGRRVLSRMPMMLVQSDADAERLKELGARPETVHVVGSVKFDNAPLNPDGVRKVRTLLDAIGFRCEHPLLVCGSTWPGEEEALLGIYRRLRSHLPGLKMVLVPRHAERRVEVCAAVAQAGFRCVRRSSVMTAAPEGVEPDVLVVDTTGELNNFYAAADVVFVGKSLTQHGGQNIIEPAALGKAVVVGPHTENFSSVMPDFIAANAITQVADRAELERALSELLTHRSQRDRLGAAALAVVTAGQGRMAETARRVCEHIPPAGANGELG